MKKLNLLLIFVSISFFGYLVYSYFSEHKRIKSLIINDRIDKITYDNKNYPIVYLNNIKIKLDHIDVRLGDSISKEKNTLWYSLYRNGKQIGFFEW
jgi:hypothetical protein